MSDKSVGERLGEAANKAKDKLENAGKAVEHSVKGAGNRASANAHDAKAETSDNVFEKAEHTVKGGVDRAKANVNEGKADYHEERAKD